MDEDLGLDIKVKQESCCTEVTVDHGRDGLEELFPWSEDESHLDPIAYVEIKCEAQDLDATTDATSRGNPEGKDSPGPVLQSSVADVDADTSIDVQREGQDFEMATDPNLISKDPEEPVPAKHNKCRKATTCVVDRSPWSWDMDHDSAGLDVKVKQESCTEVSMDQGKGGLEGVCQISQSSYSASINLAQKVGAPKAEDDTTEVTPPDLGFAVVDVNRVQPLEPGQTPKVDPLQLLSPPIKDEPPLGLQETLFVDIKREPESPGHPGDTVSFSWSVDKSPSDPLALIKKDKKGESQDTETATDVTSRVSPEDKDSTVPVLGKTPSTVSAMEDPTAKHNKRTRKKRFTCDVCQAKFNRKAVFTTHIYMHTGVKPYACDLCEARFTRTTGLNIHMQTHAGVKPHACDLCQARYSRPSHLTTHMLTHSGVKPHACDLCQARFYRKSTLTIHMKIHSGVKPYACDKCQGRFSQKAHLTIHMKTHTGVKPYACNKCQERFYQKANLTAHMQMHTGMKPFACDKCQATYSWKSGLTAHMKTHGGEISRV